MCPSDGTTQSLKHWTVQTDISTEREQTMIIWPIEVGKTVKHQIELGRQGEHKARQIQFDLTQMIDTYGEKAVSHP
jgi:hypothetical protein